MELCATRRWVWPNLAQFGLAVVAKTVCVRIFLFFFLRRKPVLRRYCTQQSGRSLCWIAPSDSVFSFESWPAHLVCEKLYLYLAGQVARLQIDVRKATHIIRIYGHSILCWVYCCTSALLSVWHIWSCLLLYYTVLHWFVTTSSLSI